MVEFTGQTELRRDVISALGPMIPELDKWRETWAMLSDEKKIEWLVEGKSMFVSAAGGIFVYLYPFFKSLCDEIESGQIVLNIDDMTIGRPTGG